MFFESNYGLIVAGVFHEIILSQFAFLGKQEITKEEYLTQAKDFLSDVETRITKQWDELDEVIQIN